MHRYSYTVGTAPYHRTLPVQYSSRITQTPTEQEKEQKKVAAIALGVSSALYTGYLIYNKIYDVQGLHWLGIGLQSASFIAVIYNLYLNFK